MPVGPTNSFKRKPWLIEAAEIKSFATSTASTTELPFASSAVIVDEKVQPAPCVKFVLILSDSKNSKVLYRHIKGRWTFLLLKAVAPLMTTFLAPKIVNLRQLLPSFAPMF